MGVGSDAWGRQPKGDARSAVPSPTAAHNFIAQGPLIPRSSTVVHLPYMNLTGASWREGRGGYYYCLAIFLFFLFPPVFSVLSFSLSRPFDIPLSCVCVARAQDVSFSKLLIIPSIFVWSWVIPIRFLSERGAQQIIRDERNSDAIWWGRVDEDWNILYMWRWRRTRFRSQYAGMVDAVGHIVQDSLDIGSAEWCRYRPQ